MSFQNSNSDLNRRLLDIYIQQYNDTLDRIDYLYRSLELTNHRIETLSNRSFNTGRNRRNRNNFYNENYTNTEYPRHRNYSTLPNNNNNNNNTNLTNDFTNLISTFFTSVIIAPTQDDINNSTTVVRFDSIENPLNESCPISLERFHNEDYVTQIIYCGHIFKTNELNSWFSNNVRCPVCRYDIRNYSSPGLTEEINSNSNINSENNSSVINNLTQQLVSSLFNSETYNNYSNDRLLMDVSNNILYFETLIHPRNNSNNSNPNSNSNI
jgi:hypothetical protein